jgi:type III secretion protein L
MAALFLLSGLDPAIKPGVKLVKADQAKVFLDASELSKRVKDLEAQTLARAEQAYQKRREEGYRDGLIAGRDEYALKIMDTVMASVEYLEGLESDLVKIVNEAVRKIIGDLGSDEAVVRVVKKALTSMRDDRRVLVRVSPRDEPAVREALLGSSGQRSPFLDVRADGRLEQGQCVLESELGVVEASLETQLKNLSEALQSRIKSGV